MSVSKQMAMGFGEISIGNILTIVAAGVSALAAFFGVKGKLDLVEQSNQMQLELIAGIQAEVRQLREVVVTIGRFDERLQSLQREVTELRHGKGLVLNGVRET